MPCCTIARDHHCCKPNCPVTPRDQHAMKTVVQRTRETVTHTSILRLMAQPYSAALCHDDVRTLGTRRPRCAQVLTILDWHH